MLPIERQERIRELILENKNMKITELSRILNVSEMTIHRDLKPLIEDGLIIKTFGGITLVRESANTLSSSQGECVYCNKKVDDHLVYRIILPENKVEVACCAHCGLLRHQQLGDEILQAICHDFLRKTTISAPLTWFVMETSLNMGCCQPQVLTFEYKKHADQFVKGFGGEVFPFEEALSELPNKMNLKKDHHCCD